jgi:quercetin dioxygenase-like cupin family protein
MRVVRSGDVVAGDTPEGLAATWLEGPHQNAGLDVAIVRFGAGSATPPHVHHGGQLLVMLEGLGFVEVGGVRTVIHPWDIVITPAEEWHLHGATEAGACSHLSVTTGRNEIADGDYRSEP